MNQAHTNFELIESFLLNKLSESEREAFEKQLATDPSLREQLNKHRQLVRFVEDATLVEIKNKLKHIDNQHTPKQFENSRNFIFIAGIIAFILAVSFFLRLSHKVTNKPQKDSTIQQSELNETQIKASEEREKSVGFSKDINADPESEVKGKKENTDLPDKAMSVHPTSETNFASIPITDALPESTQAPIKEEPAVNVVSPFKSDKAADELKYPCQDIEIRAEVLVKESCSNKATGQLIISPEEITGGTAPFEAFLAGKTIPKGLHFKDLFPGIYQLHITDATGCTSLLGNFTVNSIDCSYDYVFAPDKGEEWEIPLIETDGKIKIYSKAGILVYEQMLFAGTRHTWQGTNSSGYGLAMGVYIFVIECPSGEPLQGTITLVR